MQGGAHRLVLRGGEHDRLLRAFSRGDRPMAAGSSAVARDPVAMRRPQTRSNRPLKADRQALSGIVLRQVRAKSAPSPRQVAAPSRFGTASLALAARRRLTDTALPVAVTVSYGVCCDFLEENQGSQEDVT